jgi:hypothetical protein
MVDWHPVLLATVLVQAEYAAKTLLLVVAGLAAQYSADAGAGEQQRADQRRSRRPTRLSAGMPSSSLRASSVEVIGVAPTRREKVGPLTSTAGERLSASSGVRLQTTQFDGQVNVLYALNMYREKEDDHAPGACRR